MWDLLERSIREVKKGVLMIVQHTTRGRTIKLFLLDGTSDGKIEASLDNWTGRLVRAGSSNLEWLLGHKSAQKSGLYLFYFFYLKSESETQQRIYIGRSDKIEQRLRCHARDKDKGFWETACLITTSDGSLYGTSCDYIETYLIAETLKAKRTTLHNKQRKSISQIPLPQSEKESADIFIENLKIILPTINFNFLKQLQSQSKNVKDFMFEIFHKSSGVRARANEINGDFFVLKGSQATTKGRKESLHRKRRQILIDKGDLKQIGDSTTYEFTKDVHFSSPSASASIVIDGQASPREWKIKGTKTQKNYNDWRENPQAFIANFS